MNDPRNIHPRELVRGLMRGHRPELKLGYTAENAVLAAQTIHGEDLPAADYERLQNFADGFAAGLAENNRLTYPASD